MSGGLLLEKKFREGKDGKPGFYFIKTSTDGDMAAFGAEAKTVEGLGIGDPVEYEIKVSGEGRKSVKEIRRNGTAVSAPVATTTSSGGGWKPDPNKDAMVMTSYVLETIDRAGLTKEYVKNSNDAHSLVLGVFQTMKIELNPQKPVSQ